jgi:hypothetical protein
MSEFHMFLTLQKLYVSESAQNLTILTCGKDSIWNSEHVRNPFKFWISEHPSKILHF